MANIDKRLENLERKIPQSVPNEPSDAELALRLAAKIDELQERGYITQDGEISPDCPMEQRSMALLGGLLLKGEL